MVMTLGAGAGVLSSSSSLQAKELIPIRAAKARRLIYLVERVRMFFVF